MMMVVMMVCGHVYYEYVEDKYQLYEASPLLSLSILTWSCTQITKISAGSH